MRAEWMTGWAQTSRPSDDVTNGWVARELPVASALLIRRDVAQFRPLAKLIHPAHSPQQAHAERRGGALVKGDGL